MIKIHKNVLLGILFAIDDTSSKPLFENSKERFYFEKILHTMIDMIVIGVEKGHL